MTTGLVLGGGGITGIAWEIGLVAGLAAEGIHLRGADVVIGTSAGSVVGAQLTSGADLDELYEKQLRPPASTPPANLGRRVTLGYAASMILARGNLERFGARVGRRSQRLAAAGRLPTLAARFEAIEARLPSLEWAERDLRVTAVNARTGVFRTITRQDGVPLRDAIAASCAVPCVYPPVPIDGERYVDGGVRSGANADLAAGCDRVVALTPFDRAVGPLRSARQQLDELGIAHEIVAPDDAAQQAIGRNVLDDAARAGSARAGRAQAAAVADRIRAVWT